MKKARLSILIPLLLILSSLASSTLLFWQEIRIANRTIQQAGTDNLHTTLTHLQNMLNTQLANDSLEDAKLSLAVSALHPGIRTLLLADENNTVILANRYIWEGSRAIQVSGYNDSIAQQVRQNQASNVSFNGGQLSGYYPVTLRLVAGGLGVNRIGVLFVEYDLAPQLAQARHDAVVQASSFGSLMIAVSIAVAMLLHWLVSRRVEKMANAAKRFAAGDLDARINLRGHDELAELGHALDYMARQRQAAEETIRELNQSLEKRVQEEVAQNREKDHILIQQSRLAAMGEMVHNIAHQWRQPLNTLSIILTNIKDEYDYQELTSESLDKTIKQARQILQRMSTTVDDFRDFFRPDREPGEFDMSQAVEDALFVMEASLMNNHIEVEKNMPTGLMAYGYSNQFAQVILNILANAKEAIQHRMTSGGRIKIRLSQSDGQGILAIEDNGGGIPDNVRPKIFDPYFTTKDKGSGIGLYMSKMITERNLSGKIEATNTDQGALITITLPLLNKGTLP